MSVFFASFWGFWGIIENFHEGWYYDSFFMSIGLMLYQYLFFTIIFVSFTFVAIKKRKIGAFLFILIAIAIPLFRVRSFAAIVTFSIPMAIIGLLFLFGEVKNKRLGYIISIGLPLLVVIGFGLEPILRVPQRIDDGNYECRLVKGNGVELVWAPIGPGWTVDTEEMKGKKWDDIVTICSCLTEDGRTLADSAVNIWRLPTIDEAVRSLTRNGKNSGGVWDKDKLTAEYDIQPDKESPLWKVNSPIIYWWTASELNDSTAFRIVYNGSVQSINKKTNMGSLGFRAVKLKDIK